MMKYINGVDIEPRYDELSPLDRAINSYSKKADEYYKKLKEADKSPPDVREKRKKELEKIKKELEHYKRNAETYADIQAQLDAYRALGRDATQGARSEVARKQRALGLEKHHPAKEPLGKFMIAVGKIKPPGNYTAHHIVPGLGKTKAANLARVHLHRFGIRINDPDNGVWLPTYKKHTPAWAMPDAKGHLEYHTESYEEWLSKKIRMKMNETVIRAELNIVGKLLQDNNLPEEAKKKKR